MGGSRAPRAQHSEEQCPLLSPSSPVKLGVAEAFDEQRRRWGRIHERIQVIERVELERARREWIELGYRGDLVSILGSEAHSPVVLSERELRGLTKIERVLRGRNLRQRDASRQNVQLPSLQH